MRSLILPLIAAAGLVACTQTPAETARAADREAGEQAKLQRRLAGLVPGKPQSCIAQYDTRDAQVSSYGNTILYTLGRDTAYRSDTSGGCSDLGGSGHNILVTKTFSSQLCQGDIATTVDNSSHFQSGSCGFGPFVRYSRPK
ncbi:hypothetical protein [uncultured Sphingomonas sp.]|uniref:hypothetical protein n=1 Tax=uncultured Sphingomonas sp. TaxID=158754 RepID=UPI0035CAA918